MTAPVLECRDFSFSYGKSRILDRINFRLQRGEWLTILGPNGSGKSTLLKNMLRLADGGSSSGELLVCDRPLDSYSQIELARLLAYVPQAGGRIPPFKVREFVNLSRFPYRWRQGAKQEQNSESVRQALVMTGTDHLADRPMDKLSGGQRQRVFLAAALAQDTGTLLLDEPASFLDPRHAHVLNLLLKQLSRERGMTIIVVTHDLNQPFDAGGKALIIANSRQTYFGPADDLRNNGVLDSSFEHEFSYLVHPKTRKTLVVA